MRRLLGIVLLLVSTTLVPASQFTRGNVLISQGNIGSDQRRIKEYTRNGAFVQSISVPAIAGQDFRDYNRGMAIDYRGRLHVFNGSSNNVSLSTYDPSTSSWSHLAIPGLTSGNNTTFGKIATFQDYVFLSDHSDSVGSEMGLVRVDTRTNDVVRFARPNSSNDVSIDLNIGPDGLLYSLAGAGVPSGLCIEIYDPNTLILVRTIELIWVLVANGASRVRDAVVRSDGNIWLNQTVSPAILIDPNGVDLGTFGFSSNKSIIDFDVAFDGLLMQAEDGGVVYLYDSNFSRIRSFDTSSDTTTWCFGLFVPDIGAKVWPDSFLMARGVLTGGSLSDLLASDDQRLEIRAGLTLFLGESPLQVVVTGTSPVQSPSELRFKLEASANTPGLSQTIELFNYDTSLYEQVDLGIPGAMDAIVDVVITTNPGRFVQVATGEMRARMVYQRVGFTLLWPWSARIDQAVWKITP